MSVPLRQQYAPQCCAHTLCVTLVKSNHRTAHSLFVRLFLLRVVSLVGLLRGEQKSAIPMTDPSTRNINGDAMRTSVGVIQPIAVSRDLPPDHMATLVILPSCLCTA